MSLGISVVLLPAADSTASATPNDITDLSYLAFSDVSSVLFDYSYLSLRALLMFLQSPLETFLHS